MEASHDTELAYRRVRAHTLLNINNQNFSNTNVSQRTSAGSEECNLAVVVAYYCRVLVGDPEQHKLWLLAIAHPDVSTLWDALQQNNSVLCVCTDHFS